MLAKTCPFILPLKLRNASLGVYYEDSSIFGMEQCVESRVDVLIAHQRSEIKTCFELFHVLIPSAFVFVK